MLISLTTSLLMLLFTLLFMFISIAALVFFLTHLVKSEEKLERAIIGGKRKEILDLLSAHNGVMTMNEIKTQLKAGELKAGLAIASLESEGFVTQSKRKVILLKKI
ncbi:MAG: hypothetical protein V1859_07890 [archaeon]